MNLRRRRSLLVFQTSSVLMGYCRMMESNSRHICSSLQTKGRWMFGSQKPPSSSELLRNVTILRRECLGVFMIGLPNGRVLEGGSPAHAANFPNQNAHVIAGFVRHEPRAVGVWELKCVALAEIREVVAIVGFTFLDRNLFQGGGHRHRKKTS